MKKIIIAAMLLAFPVAAQQPSTQQSPFEEAMGAKLMQEINAGLQCTSGAVDLGRKLAAAQARVKELEEKYEPKKDVPAKKP